MSRKSTFILLLLTSRFAFGALGANADTVSMRTTQLKHFMLHEKSQKRLLYREYSNNGKVFAITWGGKSHPNMTKVMGDNFEKFSKALAKAKENHHGHDPIQIEFENLHLEMGGSMRSVQGKAWLIDQVPNGVSTDEIQ